MINFLIEKISFCLEFLIEIISQIVNDYLVFPFEHAPYLLIFYLIVGYVIFRKLSILNTTTHELKSLSALGCILYHILISGLKYFAFWYFFGFEPQQSDQFYFSARLIVFVCNFLIFKIMILHESNALITFHYFSSFLQILIANYAVLRILKARFLVINFTTVEIRSVFVAYELILFGFNFCALYFN